MTAFRPGDRVHLKGHARTPATTGTVVNAERFAGGHVFVRWDDNQAVTSHLPQHLELVGEPMSADPSIEAAARALNTAGWTCCEGSDEPGQYDECEDCKRYCDTMARAALAAADKAATITTEWGVRYSDSGYVSRHMSEGSARETADTHNAHDKTNWGQSFDMQVVSRTVTEWKETPDDHPTA